MSGTQRSHTFREPRPRRGGRTLRIPPWLSMAQRLKDSALKVEILRDEKAQRELKAAANGEECCKDRDRELMLAEIRYREDLLCYEAEIRKVKNELKRTKLPITITPARVNHPVLVNGHDGTEPVRALMPSVESNDPADKDVLIDQQAVNDIWQKMADEYQRPMVAMVNGQSVTINPRERAT